MPSLSRVTKLPSHARRVLDALEGGGYEAWVVGGWVRDSLLGNPPHDVDICSAAPWRDAERVLTAAGIAVRETGTAHGTVTAVLDGRSVEVTTYRVEGAYSDLRHPDEVSFVTDVRADLARRDFTINAMAWHPARGLLDPYGGADDLARGIIRAVGEPRERFGEDALRVLRAVRFACVLGFSVEPATQAALVTCAPELAHIARERIGAEMDGIVRSGRAGWAMREEEEVACAAIPELRALVGFAQRSPYHCYDVYVHTSHVCDAVEELTGGTAPARLRWAALLHDVGKPRCLTVDGRGQGHFFGHPATGARMADGIMRGLALPLGLVRPCVALVRLHDRPVRASRQSVLRTLADIDERCPGEAEALAYELLGIKRADALSKATPYRGYASELDAVELVLRRVLSDGPVYRVRDLAVTGADVMEATDMGPGPAVGEVLSRCLRAVMDGRVANERAALMAFSRDVR